MNAHLIKLALQLLSCSQQQLATMLSVSPTQITKWKQNEYMSIEMEEKIRELIGIGTLNPIFILSFLSTEKAKNWIELIIAITRKAEKEYSNKLAPLSNQEIETITAQFLEALYDLNYPLPIPYPDKLDSFIQDDDIRHHLLNEWTENNDFCALIHQFFSSFLRTYGFYTEHIENIKNTFPTSPLSDAIAELKAQIAHLSIINSHSILQSLPSFYEYQTRTQEYCTDLLNSIKKEAFKRHFSLDVELMDLLDNSSPNLEKNAQHTPEKQHPDIYMDEMLQHMRFMRAALTAILEKLEIDIPKTLY